MTRVSTHFPLGFPSESPLCRLHRALDSYIANCRNTPLGAAHRSIKGMVSGRYSLIPILEVLVVDELFIIFNPSQITFHYLTSRTAISLELNSGFVEGENGRLKAIKRNMFGRAGQTHLFYKMYAVSIVKSGERKVQDLLVVK